MLDLNEIRDDPDRVTRALEKRLGSVDLSRLLACDTERRALIAESDELKSRRNSVSSEIPKLKRAGEDAGELLEEMKQVSGRIKEMDRRLDELGTAIRAELDQLPNIPDDDVVAGGKEHNEVVSVQGNKPSFAFETRDHFALATELGLIDFERGARIAGTGNWIYRGAGARLEWALLQYFIQRHTAAGYEFLLIPHVLNERCGYNAGQFPKFNDDVFFVETGGEAAKFLLPTAETAVSSFHQDEILDEDSLPRKYVAYSPCFRKEAGSYRSHDRGTIRGHQFNKVELFQFTVAERSDEAHQDMLGQAESIVRDLGVHYRVSKLAAGDASAAAAKTFDIEVWVPSMGSYEEVSSVSNARSYQARRAGTRVRRANGPNEHVHMLNASGLATSRLLPALLECNQRSDGGIDVPKVLQPLFGAERIGSP